MGIDYTIVAKEKKSYGYVITAISNLGNTISFVLNNTNAESLPNNFNLNPIGKSKIILTH